MDVFRMALVTVARDLRLIVQKVKPTTKTRTRRDLRRRTDTDPVRRLAVIT